jgi:DNA-binding transcriptional MerR regulator
MNNAISLAPVGHLDTDIVCIDVHDRASSPDSAALSTSQVSEKFNLSTRTLRLYARKGLLAPTRNGRERLYSSLDQIHLMLILQGRRLGFTLDEIAWMIAAREGRASPSEVSALRQGCLQRMQRMQQLQSRLLKATELLGELQRLHMSL